MWLAFNQSSVTSGEKVDVQNVMHGQLSLAAVNQMCVIDEAMNGCKNLNIY